MTATAQKKNLQYTVHANFYTEETLLLKYLKCQMSKTMDIEYMQYNFIVLLKWPYHVCEVLDFLYHLK